MENHNQIFATAVHAVGSCGGEGHCPVCDERPLTNREATQILRGHGRDARYSNFLLYSGVVQIDGMSMEQLLAFIACAS